MSTLGRTKHAVLTPTKPYYFFVPHKHDSCYEYKLYVSVNDVFRVTGGGITTDRDELFFDTDKDDLRKRMIHFYSTDGIKDPFRTTFRVENSSSYPILDRRAHTHFR